MDGGEDQRLGEEGDKISFSSQEIDAPNPARAVVENWRQDYAKLSELEESKLWSLYTISAELYETVAKE